MSEPASSSRLLSLDVFRGGTVAAMILVNNPGNGEAIYDPLEHASWHGWTFTDLVFPFFLWIVGVAITFSFAKRMARGDDCGRLFLHVLRRSALIFLVGLFLTGVPYFHWSTIRIPGVLPRIAVCYLIAASIFLVTGLRGRILWTIGLLALYWVLMMYAPVPGYGAGHLDKEGNFAHYVDGLLLSGHMWSQTKTWDPEGVVSTLPAIATTLFGIFAGMLLQGRASRETKTGWLFLTGNVLLLAGLLLSTWMPINKSLWTDSFSLFMAGMAFVVFACCYWLIDVQGYRRFTWPFVVFGSNALTIFALSGLLGKTLGMVKINDAGRSISLHSWIYRHLYAPLGEAHVTSLLFAMTMVLLFFGVGYTMYRRQWVVRL